MLAVAMRKVFRTAMSGRCAAWPELAAAKLPLEVTTPALSCRGGTGLVQRLLRPVGWQMRTQPLPLDPRLPW